MPVTKYRSAAEMPALPRSSDDELIARIRASWTRAFLLSPRSMPRGVRRFRSIEEANADRERETLRRMRERAEP